MADLVPQNYLPILILMLALPPLLAVVVGTVPPTRGGRRRTAVTAPRGDRDAAACEGGRDHNVMPPSR